MSGNTSMRTANSSRPRATIKSKEVTCGKPIRLLPEMIAPSIWVIGSRNIMNGTKPVIMNSTIGTPPGSLERVAVMIVAKIVTNSIGSSRAHRNPSFCCP